MKNKTCEECKYYQVCDEGWRFSDDANFELSCFEPKPTVFHRITESPEVLAPYFVRADFDEPFLPWFSTLTNELFETHEESIAATVAELKEMVE